MDSERCYFNSKYFVYTREADTIYHGREKPEQTTEIHHTMPWVSIRSCFMRYITKDERKVFDCLFIVLKQTLEGGENESFSIKNEELAKKFVKEFHQWLLIQ